MVVASRRVDSVLPLVQLFEPERLVDVETTHYLEESLREVGVDAPIAVLVGVDQGASRNGAAPKAQVVELVGYGSETGFNVAQALGT